jgi:two-component system, OmpR family, response regulator VicR
VDLARLLLVDDEVPFMETLSKRLSKRDLVVPIATSGPEALYRLKTESHIDADAVVLDAKMPGMDGWLIGRT